MATAKPYLLSQRRLIMDRFFSIVIGVCNSLNHAHNGYRAQTSKWIPNCKIYKQRKNQVPSALISFECWQKILFFFSGVFNFLLLRIKIIWAYPHSRALAAIE